MLIDYLWEFDINVILFVCPQVVQDSIAALQPLITHLEETGQDLMKFTSPEDNDHIVDKTVAAKKRYSVLKTQLDEKGEKCLPVTLGGLKITANVCSGLPFDRSTFHMSGHFDRPGGNVLCRLRVHSLPYLVKRF